MKHSPSSESHSNSNNCLNHVRSSLKHVLNSSVYICRLNAMYNSVVLTDAGTVFQAHAAATGNAQSPSVVRCVVSTSSVDVDPEWSRRRDSTPDVRWSVSARYDGAGGRWYQPQKYRPQAMTISATGNDSIGHISATHNLYTCRTTSMMLLMMMLNDDDHDDCDKGDRKLSYHKQAMRLLHNIEIRDLY